MKYVVVGGGIAGVRCVEELARFCPQDEVYLVSETTRLKDAGNVRRITANTESFEVNNYSHAVVEKDLHSLPYNNIHAIQASANTLSPADKTLHLSDGSQLAYDKICICTGAKPKKVLEHPNVLVLRDHDTVADLSARLKTARKVVLVGNGGIALELAYCLRGLKVVWVMKHNHIGDAFFDHDAADFLRQELEQRAERKESGEHGRAHSRVASGSSLHIREQERPKTVSGTHHHFGHSVGPEWVKSLPSNASESSLTIETGCEVQTLEDRQTEASDLLPIDVVLTNGHRHSADFVISAVGVVPNTDWLQNDVPLDEEDGGILVDRNMESQCPGVFAAGDACCLRWPDLSSHWFQMRLWTQAKITGTYAAHCMAGVQEQTGLDISFELFTHVTKFLDKKVVLLGQYNAQGIPDEGAQHLVSYARSTEGPDSHFVRVLLYKGRMIGAVHIGDTDMEEACENLILDGLDLSQYGPEILDPDLEFDHVFD